MFKYFKNLFNKPFNMMLNFYGMKINDNGNKIIRTLNYASRYKNIKTQVSRMIKKLLL